MTEIQSGSMKFVMRGVRQILDSEPEAQFLESQVINLENAVYTYPSLSFDLARAIVETVCRTICGDLGASISKEPKIKKQLNATIKVLQTQPAFIADKEYKKQIGEIISGLTKIVTGISQLRNQYGMASHGKDAFRKMADIPQAEAVAAAADVIAHYLMQSWFVVRKPKEKEEISYYDNQEFNDNIDVTEGPLYIMGGEYITSLVLFNTDIEAYKATLLDWNKEEKANTEEDNEEN